jgi:hypothetical protein
MERPLLGPGVWPGPSSLPALLFFFFFFCSVAGARGEPSSPSMDLDFLVGTLCGGVGHLDTALSAGPLGRL